MAAKGPKSAKSKPLVDEGNLKTATERPVAAKKLDATLSTLVADGQPRKRGRPPSATKGAPKPFVEKGRPKILKETHLDDQNMLLPAKATPYQTEQVARVPTAHARQVLDGFNTVKVAKRNVTGRFPLAMAAETLLI